MLGKVKDIETLKEKEPGTPEAASFNHLSWCFHSQPAFWLMSHEHGELNNYRGTSLGSLHWHEGTHQAVFLIFWK